MEEKEEKELIHCWKCGKEGERYPGKRICRVCRREQDMSKPSVTGRRRYRRKVAEPTGPTLSSIWLTKSIKYEEQ